MKQFFTNNKLTLLLGLAFILIFVVSGVLSTTFQNVREERADRMTYLPAYPNGEKLVERSSEGFMSQPDGTKIIKAFDVMVGKEVVGMIYVAEAEGRNEGLQFAFGVEKATKKLLGYAIIQNNETPSYFQRLNPAFYAQLSNKNLDDVSFSINLVSGATQSSTAIEKMVKLVRLQFGKDIGWDVPSIAVNITSKKQDFSDLTSAKYLYTFAYNIDGTDYTNVVTLERNQAANPYYKFVSSTVEADEVLQGLFELEASKAENRVKATIISVTGLNVVVSTQGYAGEIRGTATMNVDGSIASFVITQESETYFEFDPYDPIQQLPGVYVTEQGDLDNAPLSTGATVTSRAVKELFRAVLAYGMEVGFNG